MLSGKLIIGPFFLILIIALFIPQTAFAHVRLNSPNGGEVLQGGTTFMIEWEVTAEHETENWDLRYSTNGATGPWDPIALDLPVGDPSIGSVHTYNWTVPFIDDNDVRVQITQDNAGLDYTDFSDNDLEITTTASIKRFCFFLEPEQANNCAGTGSGSNGYCIAVLSSDQSQLSFFIEHDVASPISIEIRNAGQCATGSVSHAMIGTTSPVSENWSIDSAGVANLLDGELYLVINSTSFPDGEIRGQIVQEPIKYLFMLDESQPNAGSGTGSFSNGYAIGVLDASGSSFEIDIYHDIPSGIINSAGIYYGAKGTNGSLQYTISGFASPINQSWGFSISDISALMSDQLYISINTFTNPGGEIRGQIERDIMRWAFKLNEDDLAGGKARGFGVFELTEKYDAMSIYCEHDASIVDSGSIRIGEIGIEGPLLYQFSNSNSPIDESWPLSGGNLSNLLENLLHVRIYSSEFSDGTIRGQVNHDTIGLDFELTESEVNGCLGSGSGSSGTCSASLKEGARQITLSLTHDIGNATSGHIRLGDKCVAGGSLYEFDNAADPISEIWYLSRDNVIDYMRGELYSEIYSTSYPSGEIRGQLATPEFVCGDASGNGTVNILDITYLILFLYADGLAPVPAESGDVNNSGSTNILDITYLIAYLYQGGQDPNCP